MSTHTNDSDWLSDRTGLAFLAVLSALLAFLVLLPYLQYVLLAVVLAYILYPGQRLLEAYVRSTSAALLLVLLTFVIVVLPIAYIVMIAVRQAFEIVTALEAGQFDIDVVQSRFDAVIPGYEIDVTEIYVTYREPIETGVQTVATWMVGIIGSLPEVLIGLTVSAFVLFSLLRDGDRFLVWFRAVLPVEASIEAEMLAELDRLMWASVVGNVAVAGIQALLLGFGLVVLDVPTVVFFVVATFILALLPIVGAFGVWMPLSVYLVAVGRPTAGALLFGYGMLVSASDIYLRPALIGRESAINIATIVIGIFGGIVVFGAIGLFVGPVVLGGAKIVLEMFARERRGGKPV